jgi:hypothetical protein
VRLVRLGNPFVRAILGSRLHPLLSARLLVLTYRGRRTGRSFDIPVRYAEADEGRLVIVAVRPERKLWWRSFDGGANATVTLRGARIAVRGALQTGVAREQALAAYVARYPRSARLVRDAAVVVVAPSR